MYLTSICSAIQAHPSGRWIILCAFTITQSADLFPTIKTIYTSVLPYKKSKGNRKKWFDEELEVMSAYCLTVCIDVKLYQMPNLNN